MLKGDIIVYLDNYMIKSTEEFGVKFLAAMINSCPEPISISKNGICLLANRAYHKIVGAREGELVGRHLQELVDDNIINPSAGLLALRKNMKLGYVLQYLPRTNKEVMLTGYSILNESGEPEFLVSTIRDLDDFNRIRNKLKELQIGGVGTSRDLDELNSLTLQLKDNSINHIYCIPDTIGVFNQEKTMVVESDSMKRIIRKVELVAKSDIPVLITGETGTGKEMIARIIHNKSPRSKHPFITINCATVPENLFEAELFGYRGGAFTGADKQGKPGLIEIAHSGTFFFDEIAELPLNVQAKFLRVFEDMEIRQLGSTKSKKVDVRIVAATNKDLKAEISHGKFREDLFYRLSVVPIELPPVRQRKEEILPLIRLFLREYNKKYGHKKEFSLPACQYLAKYSWPGNIREIKNLINNLVICSEGDIIDVHDLPPYIAGVTDSEAGTDEKQSLKSVIKEFEKRHLVDAIKKHGSTRKAAKALGLSHTTFVRKLNQYNGI